MTRRVRLCTLIALLVGLSAGCNHQGASTTTRLRDPLLPFHELVTTSKPAAGYPRLEVQVYQPAAPVMAQQILLATVYDAEGSPDTMQRVDWVLEGAGGIVRVDDNGLVFRRGRRVDNQYAYSYTERSEGKVSRREGRPQDDFVVATGQTWCAVSSAQEGETRITVRAPGLAGSAGDRQVVSLHWIDAGYVIPSPRVGRAGERVELSTRVYRASDRQPLAGYQVRYRPVDGPAVVFLPDQGREAVVATGAQGEAPVAVLAQATQPGSTRIAVDILRTDPAAPAGASAVVGQGSTTIDWQAPEIHLEQSAPASVSVGQEVPITLAVASGNDLAARTVTVRAILDPSLEVVRVDPPAARDGGELIWTLAELQGQARRQLQVVCKSKQVGAVSCRGILATGEGLHDERELTVQVLPPEEPRLEVVLQGPAAAVLSQARSAGAAGSPIPLQVAVRNTGTGPARNVTLEAAFDGLVEHPSGKQKLETTVASLLPGASQNLPLAVRATKPGQALCRVTARADGGLSARAEHVVQVEQAGIILEVSGPATRYVGRPVEWSLVVRNPGTSPLARVTVSQILPPEVAFVGASDGGQPRGREVIWVVGTLGPGEKKQLQLRGTAARLAEKTVSRAMAAALTSGRPPAGGPAGASAPTRVETRTEMWLTILGLPAFQLSVSDQVDPIQVGMRTAYRIDLRGHGSLPAQRVQIVGHVPPEMKVLGVSGPLAYRVEGQQVTFSPLPTLMPGQRLTCVIEVEAVKAGDARFRAELTSATLKQPLFEEESTNVR